MASSRRKGSSNDDPEYVPPPSSDESEESDYRPCTKKMKTSHDDRASASDSLFTDLTPNYDLTNIAHRWSHAPVNHFYIDVLTSVETLASTVHGSSGNILRILNKHGFQIENWPVIKFCSGDKNHHHLLKLITKKLHQFIGMTNYFRDT